MAESNEGAAASGSQEATIQRPFSAEEMRALHTIPLFGLNGFSVQNGFLEVTGLALPVDGDHKTVKFIADPGVEFSVEYPVRNAVAAVTYWYWPGADNCAFRLRVDLAATSTDVEHYKFRIRFAGHANRPLETTRTTVAVPKNIGLLENYPTHAGIQRVQKRNTINNVAATGLSDAWRMCELGRHYGWDGAGAVLDWGVGHGRVARHINAFAPEASVFGVDIDPDNIAWAQSHLPSLSVGVGPLMPPTTYADNQFSLIYGISVMTHLERSVQEAWLAEIRRILRPGGLALLTFAGDSSLAFASRWLDRAYLDTYLATGFGPHLGSNDLVGVIETPEYYKNIKQTMGRAKEICSEYLDVVGAHECMFGYQDLLVLRKKKRVGRAAHAESGQEESAPASTSKAVAPALNDASAPSVQASAVDSALSDKIRDALARNPNLSAAELRNEVGVKGPAFARALRASGIRLDNRSKGGEKANGPAQPLSEEQESRRQADLALEVQIRDALARNPHITVRELRRELGVAGTTLMQALRRAGIEIPRS